MQPTDPLCIKPRDKPFSVFQHFRVFAGMPRVLAHVHVFKVVDFHDEPFGAGGWSYRGAVTF